MPRRIISEGDIYGLARAQLERAVRKRHMDKLSCASAGEKLRIERLIRQEVNAEMWKRFPYSEQGPDIPLIH